MSTPIEGIPGIPMNAGITGINTTTIPKIIPPVQPAQAETTPTDLDEIKESSFGSLFTDLIQNVKDTDAEFTQAQYLLATGQLDNPAQLGIAGYKAEISLQMLIQLRNRALEAYNELKNIDRKSVV